MRWSPMEILDLDTVPAMQAAVVGLRADDVAIQGSALELVRTLAVRAIRTGSAGDLIEAAIAIHDAVPEEAPVPATLAQELAVLVDVLEVSSAVGGESAWPMLLRSHAGKARRVLEHLSARAASWTPKKELLEAIDISDSQLSHLLRRLQDEELVARRKVGREAELRITGLGQEAIGVVAAPHGGHSFTEDDEAALHGFALSGESPSTAKQLVLSPPAGWLVDRLDGAQRSA